MRYYTRISWEDPDGFYPTRAGITCVETADQEFSVSHEYDPAWLKRPGYSESVLRSMTYELWKIGAFDAAIVDACAPVKFIHFLKERG